MTDEDRDAARQLAAEMNYVEGAKFLHAEIGYSLREAIYDCERIAKATPASPLAASLAARDARAAAAKASALPLPLSFAGEV